MSDNKLYQMVPYNYDSAPIGVPATMQLVEVEQSECFAVRRTDGDLIDGEYTGYFQRGKSDAFGIAGELADDCDGACDCEFAVYSLVRVPEDDDDE